MRVCTGSIQRLHCRDRCAGGGPWAPAGPLTAANDCARRARAPSHAPAAAAPPLPRKVLAAQEHAARTRDPAHQWRCPACREICNCSNQNCQRSNRHLEWTNILIQEAKKYGYKSVRGATGA
jgi:hypothetical protein